MSWALGKAYGRNTERRRDARRLSGSRSGFVADDPGLTLFHCHQQLHMDFGFMTLFDYV
jgi:hypothetical protein